VFSVVSARGFHHPVDKIPLQVGVFLLYYLLQFQWIILELMSLENQESMQKHLRLLGSFFSLKIVKRVELLSSFYLCDPLLQLFDDVLQGGLLMIR